MTDPAFNPELHQNLRAALADPFTRIGSLVGVERSFPYEDRPYEDRPLPFICFTLTWIEPSDDDDESNPPKVIAMNLHIPEMLISPAVRALNDLTSTATHRPPRSNGPTRRPRRKR
jgi:hypothetical protein